MQMIEFLLSKDKDLVNAKGDGKIYLLLGCKKLAH